ncbi:MAG TPA: NUDIX hydrolase [Candidatus Limnocylindrales bacterium]
MAPASGPRVGVGGVVIQDGRALVIQRGKPPLRGRWTVPGGTVELGETLEEARVREVREETGLSVRPRQLLAVFDRIEKDAGAVSYHYVIIDFLCDYLSGSPCAGSDADAVALVGPDELAAYDLPEKSREVILDGFRLAGHLQSAGEARRMLK